MQTRVPLALSLLSLAVTLAACGNTSPVDAGGGNTGDGTAGLSVIQQDVADRVAAADQAAAALTQVLGPTADAAVAAQSRAIGASARSMQAADEVLERFLGTGSVEIGLQLSPPGYLITVTNGKLFAGTVPVNGALTVTGTMATDPRIITVATSDFTVGQCTLSGTILVTVPAAGGSITMAATDLSVAWHGAAVVSEFSLNATATATDGGGYVIDGNLVVSIEDVGGAESAEVTVTARGVESGPATAYPCAGSLAFACCGERLEIVFTGGSTATVSDREGHSATLALPALV